LDGGAGADRLRWRADVKLIRQRAYAHRWPFLLLTGAGSGEPECAVTIASDSPTACAAQTQRPWLLISFTAFLLMKGRAVVMSCTGS
jgi:hypothetical protein